MSDAAPPNWLTAEIPGTGGRLRERPEDFLVEELPRYEPSGEGEHLYLFIEKRQMSTPAVAARLARAFGVNRRAVGFAGMKDRNALTRQHFSVHLPGGAGGAEQAGLARLEEEPFALLWADRHGNKLRRGHLAGNRFVIYLRGVEPARVVDAQRVIERLAREGVPHRFGPQRFGARGDNAAVGRAILLGDHAGAVERLFGGPRAGEAEAFREARALWEAGDRKGALAAWPSSDPARRVLAAMARGAGPKRAIRELGREHGQLLVSAWQSRVFNRVLEARLGSGPWPWLAPGDLAMRHASGGVFEVGVEEAEEANAPGGRVAGLEVSATGPMWGRKMKPAGGPVAALEQTALEAEGLAPGALAEGAAPFMPPGERRPLRVPLVDEAVSAGSDERGPYLRLAFTLPAGAFATAVVAELTKQPELAGEPLGEIAP